MRRKLPVFLVVILLFILAFSSSFLLSYLKNIFGNNSATVQNNRIPSKNTQVPLPNTTPRDRDVTAPQVVLDPVMGSPNQTRKFTINGSSSGFSVKKIVVYQGDIVNLKFTASDRAMDITFPDFSISQFADIGETKTLEFQAVSPGTYTFLCQKCSDNNVKGELLVVIRQ